MYVCVCVKVQFICSDSKLSRMNELKHWQKLHPPIVYCSIGCIYFISHEREMSYSLKLPDSNLSASTYLHLYFVWSSKVSVSHSHRHSRINFDFGTLQSFCDSKEDNKKNKNARNGKRNFHWKLCRIEALFCDSSHLFDLFFVLSSASWKTSKNVINAWFRIIWRFSSIRIMHRSCFSFALCAFVNFDLVKLFLHSIKAIAIPSSRSFVFNHLIYIRILIEWTKKSFSHLPSMHKVVMSWPGHILRIRKLQNTNETD